MLSLSQELHKAMTNRRALELSETGKDGSTVWWFPESGDSQCSACWNVVCGKTWLELLVCYLSLTRENKGGLFKRKERRQAFCDHKALKKKALCTLLTQRDWGIAWAVSYKISMKMKKYVHKHLLGIWKFFINKEVISVLWRIGYGWLHQGLFKSTRVSL